jgi:dGTPase
VKYPWGRDEAPDGSGKFGVYADDAEMFDWVRGDAEPLRRPIEAQVMDLSDDVAYSVHDVEDGVVGGWFTLDLASLDDSAVHRVARDWYDAGLDAGRLSSALERLEAMPEWPRKPLDQSRASRAALKSLTSALIGRFVMAAQSATIQRWGSGPLVRYDADLEVPDATRDEITVLKSVSAHYVMRVGDRADYLGSQRELLQNLVKALVDSGGRELEPDIRADHDAASDDAGRLRAVIDQVAGLTDLSAPLWAQRLGL